MPLRTSDMGLGMGAPFIGGGTPPAEFRGAPLALREIEHEARPRGPRPGGGPSAGVVRRQSSADGLLQVQDRLRLRS